MGETSPSVETLQQMFAVDKEARRIERERCVSLVREYALIAPTDETAHFLCRLATEMEAPDAN